MALPRLSAVIDQEVKRGDIAYRLTRPVSYILFHYGEYMAEFVIRLCVNLALGGTLTLLIYKQFPLHIAGIVAFALLTVGAATLNFLINMSIAISAFWLEDTSGIELIYARLVMTIGGMMLPLSVFPTWLATIARHLPFQAISYVPARYAIQFQLAECARMFLFQWEWIAAAAVLLAVCYRLGLRKLHVNGG